MNHNLNYEKFLVTRPLWAKFEEDEFGIPIMWKTKIDIRNASYLNILNFKNLSVQKDISNYLVSCFMFDFELETIWRNPYSKLQKIRKAAVILSPDFSISPGMREAQVIENTFKNRWLCCFYQERFIDAIPTVSWAEEWTFKICAKGIPYGNPIAISTIGIKDKQMFINGYDYFMKTINPEYVICFGKPIEGMSGNLICFDYNEGFMPNKKFEQLKLFVSSRLIEIAKEER